MNRRAGKVQGFTLLEMLVAMAMVAMLAGSLYASLHIAFKARDTALRSLEDVRKADQTMELIIADLRSAMIPNGILAGAFLGLANTDPAGSQADSLTFYAAAMDIEPSPGTGDIKKIEYSCEPSSQSGEPILVRRVTTNLLATVTPEPRQEIVCRGIRSFTLRYSDGSTWQDVWDSGAQGNLLPKAVEVTIEFGGDAAAAGYVASRVVLIPCGLGGDAAASSEGEQ